MFARKLRLPLRRTRQSRTDGPTLIRTWRVLATVVVVALVSVYVAFAAISLSTTTAYTQNFDSLGIPLSSPTPSNLPTDFRQSTASAPRAIGSFAPATPQHCASAAPISRPRLRTAVTTSAPALQLWATLIARRVFSRQAQQQ